MPTPSKPDATDPAFGTARIWDLPTRAFHWLLVGSVCVGWWLGDNLSFTNIDWHFYLGYLTGGLLLFRILWGFVGPKPSRFSALFFSPGAILAYARRIGKRSPSGIAGHNPLGALSVLALLATLSVQVVTGLLSDSDDFFTSGPLAAYVDSSVTQQANAIHEISATVLLVLVGAHVTALVFYLVWKRENLIRPMITGSKLVAKEDTKDP
ncbi:MAG: cytochrome b/b6 domain-containing protein [Rhodospirillaceae bacterium]